MQEIYITFVGPLWHLLNRKGARQVAVSHHISCVSLFEFTEQPMSIPHDIQITANDQIACPEWALHSPRDGHCF